MSDSNTDLQSCVEGQDGLSVFRGGGSVRGWNNIVYKTGLSAKNVNVKSLSMNVATIPPGNVASDLQIVDVPAMSGVDTIQAPLVSPDVLAALDGAVELGAGNVQLQLLPMLSSGDASIAPGVPSLGQGFENFQPAPLIDQSGSATNDMSGMVGGINQVVGGAEAGLTQALDSNPWYGQRYEPTRYSPRCAANGSTGLLRTFPARQLP